MAEYGCCHTNGTSALRDRCAANSASREPEQVGLNVLAEMAQRYGVPIGYSDHFNGPAASLAAAALLRCTERLLCGRVER